MVGTPTSTSKAASDSSQQSARKRDTILSLRKDLDDIAARLNQADALTQQSVESLQNAFSVLEKRVSEEGSVNKAALTRRVDQLTDHLTGLINQTRAGVAQDLRQVKDNPSADTLKIAIKAAESRLTQAEITQAAALTKVNRHIAELARVIDARLTQESNLRKEAVSAVNKNVQTLEIHTKQKIRDVEKTSAEAISKLGEHVISLSNDFKNKAETNKQAISAKMSDIARKTQQEFQDYRSQIERRLESLEEGQRNLDAYTDRTFAGLTTRIDNLEYGLTSVAPPVADKKAAEEDAFSPSLDELYDSDTLTLKPEQVSPPPQIAPQPAAPQVTPQLKLVPKPVQNLAPQPAPAPISAPVPTLGTPLYSAPKPQEYVPEIYPQPYPQNGTPLIQDIKPVPPQPQEWSQPYPVPAPAPAGPESGIIFDSGDLPYDDPAYAEHFAEDSVQRPGAFDLKSKAFSKPKITARNVGVGVMSLVVATAGFFVLRGVMGGKAPTTPQNTPAAYVGNGSASALPQTVDPIGEYQEQTQTASTAMGASLETAANSGDPIAEFQLGLSYLESGDVNQAVKYIRAAANKGQPAALYRLAKLYEAGEGVQKDTAMARQLMERAAMNGNRIAMHDLALYYADGQGGVELNTRTAASWFEKAAQRGVVDSQFNLGVLYQSGQGLPKNLSEAFFRYSIAAGQGDQFAQKHIDILRQQLSPADIERVTERVAAFQPVPLDEAANGIFRNVSWGQTDNSKQEEINVKEAQTLLGQLGYNAGTPDGAMGPKTQQAVRSFQKDRGLKPTGQVNESLILQLQRAAGQAQNG